MITIFTSASLFFLYLKRIKIPLFMCSKNTTTCHYCASSFHPPYADTHYCSHQCRVAAITTAFKRQEAEDIQQVMKNIQSGALGKLVYQRQKEDSFTQKKAALQKEGKVLCPICHGRGRYMGDNCKACSGKGFISEAV